MRHYLRQAFSVGAAAFSLCAGLVGDDVFAPEAHAAIPAEAFGELPLVHDAAISPDGSKIAMLGNFNGSTGLRIISRAGTLDTNAGLQLPKGYKPGRVDWASNDQILIESWVTDEVYGYPLNTHAIYTYNVRSLKGDWLVEPQKARSLGSKLGTEDAVYEFNFADVIDYLPEDPDHILMAFADKKTGQRPVHKVNVRKGNYDTVERPNRNIQSWATDMTGVVRVGVGLDDEATTEDDRHIRIKDMDGNWKDHSHWPGLDLDAHVFGFTELPHEMIVGVRNGRDTRGLYIYDLRDKRMGRKLFHHDTYDVSGLLRDPTTRKPIGAQFVGDAVEAELFPGNDTVFNAIVSQYEDYTVKLVDASDEGDTILFELSRPYDPGMLLLKTGSQAKPIKLLDKRPGLPPSELGLVIPVKYTASDGQQIPSFVTLPPTINDTAGIDKLPFIVLPHGGPYARDAQQFDWFAQFFASRGYGVLQMNFRGSTGYGEAFAKAGRENWKVMRDDVTDGARWLVEKGYADPDRMCVAGWSYGGYAALMNGVDHPDLFSCVISVAGLSDLDEALEEMRYYRFRDVARTFITDGFVDRDEMRANSPTRVVEAMTLPTFIAHGELDSNVGYGQHRKLKNALKKSDAEVTEVNFKDDHYISNEANRKKLTKAIEKFLISVNGKSEYVKP